VGCQAAGGRTGGGFAGCPPVVASSVHGGAQLSARSVGQRVVTSRQTVEFFFSPGSRYCYLAASQLPRIAARTGCQFEWKPVRGSGIRLLRGRDPFQGDPISGQYDWDYRRRDGEMWAEYYGIPFREPPSHDFDFDLLPRAAAAARRLGSTDAYAWALCRSVYGSETWPLDRNLCIRLGMEVGLSQPPFERSLDATSTLDSLAQNQCDAHARGAFGVPTFFLGGVMFWGNDHLVLLEHALKRG